jgi:hypothetical protein
MTEVVMVSVYLSRRMPMFYYEIRHDRLLPNPYILCVHYCLFLCYCNKVIRQFANLLTCQIDVGLFKVRRFLNMRQSGVSAESWRDVLRISSQALHANPAHAACNSQKTKPGSYAKAGTLMFQERHNSKWTCMCAHSAEKSGNRT